MLPWSAAGPVFPLPDTFDPVETTAKFYLERMRVQIEQARRRQYPAASDIPAKWLNLISGRLKSAEALVNTLPKPTAPDRDLKAEILLVEITSCYEDLEVLARADVSQVDYFVVGALSAWFKTTDPSAGYLFTSGSNFEVVPLFDGGPAESWHPDYEDAVAKLPGIVYRITMPGGALGAGFHIPLVAHELGHVLLFRIERETGNPRTKALVRSRFKAGKRAILENWIAEIFADTICGYVAGPAGFFALHDKLRGGGTPSKEHPHNHIRVSSLGTFITEKYQSAFAKFGVRQNQWEQWPTRSDKELLAECKHHNEYEILSAALIRMLPIIRNTAVSLAHQYIPKLEYTPSALISDLEMNASAFLEGIPPFETFGPLLKRRATRLAAILNIGWYVAAFAVDQLNIKIANERSHGAERLVTLDQLILKAVELSEARRDWNSA
jgi:hypothetical protein